MSELKARLREDLDRARRERDKPLVMLLTTTLSEVKNREIELGRDATDDDVLDAVTKAVKRRKEAAEQMRGGNRVDLAEKEEQEAVMLGAYLPQPLSEAEVRALVREAVAGGAGNVGGVMAQVMPRLRGRFDGKEANRIVREELG